MDTKLEETDTQFRSGLTPEEMYLAGFDDIQNFMCGGGDSSFTALLELPPPQAVELLVNEAFQQKQNMPPPIFPSNIDLIDRASKFSVFASAENEGNAIFSGSLKDKNTKEWNKKGKKALANKGVDGEKLPNVPVRARRGQATDRHSLAERARREKISSRMKLLKELVPGCNKISGTAMVLDEIIYHVQDLQRQVEFLSMMVASVNASVPQIRRHT